MSFDNQCPRDYDYELIVGLHLNRSRIQYQQAANIATGSAIAGGAKPSDAFLDALVDTPEQVKVLSQEWDSKQKELETLRKLKH